MSTEVNDITCPLCRSINDLLSSQSSFQCFSCGNQFVVEQTNSGRKRVRLEGKSIAETIEAVLNVVRDKLARERQHLAEAKEVRATHYGVALALTLLALMLGLVFSASLGSLIFVFAMERAYRGYIKAGGAVEAAKEQVHRTEKNASELESWLSTAAETSAGAWTDEPEFDEQAVAVPDNDTLSRSPIWTNRKYAVGLISVMLAAGGALYLSNRSPVTFNTPLEQRMGTSTCGKSGVFEGVVTEIGRNFVLADGRGSTILVRSHTGSYVSVERGQKVRSTGKFVCEGNHPVFFESHRVDLN